MSSITNGGSLDEMLLIHLPENIERLVFPPSSRTTPHHHHHHHENKQGVSTIPVDILETQNEFHFFMDVPGLSKTDIQVTVEDDNILVIQSNGKKKKQESDKSGEEKSNNGKRKREGGSSSIGGRDEEGCKYIRLERRASPKFLRKFRLPENSNVSAITAKCENGVLTVTVEKLPPPPKPKTVQVTIS